MKSEACFIFTAGDATNPVDFLNKVIVDQQTKIEELNTKIKELESMMLNGNVEDVIEINRFVYDVQSHYLSTVVVDKRVVT